MKDMTQVAGISGKTNYSGRKTLAQKTCRTVELTTTTTTIYYPFRNYGNLIDDNLAI